MHRSDFEGLREMRKTEKELDQLLEDDEIYGKQRSRENWLQWEIVTLNGSI